VSEVRNCLSKIKGAQSRFDELVAGGVNEYVAARQVLTQKNKDLHEEMNGLKQKLGLPASEFKTDDIDISPIEKSYADAVEKLSTETEAAKKTISETAAKKKAEIKEKEEEQKEQKAAKPKYPLVGKKIKIADKEWVVQNKKGQYYISNGEVRVKIDEAGIRRLSEEKPKPTKSETKPKPLGVKEKPKKPVLGSSKKTDTVKKLQQSSGLSTEAAKEVFDLAKKVKNGEISKKQFEKQYAEIVAKDRGLKVGENNVMVASIPDVTDFESADDLVKATKEFEQNRKDYVERSAQDSVSETMDAMKSDGRVQVDKGVVELLSDQNESLFDLLTSADRPIMGAAASFIAIRRLIMNKNSNELARLFSKVGVKLKVINDGGYQVLNQRGNAIGRNLTKQQAQELASSQNGQVKIKGPIIMAAVEMQNGKPMPTIVINAASLGDRVAQLAGEKHFFNWLEAALWEEVIHLASYKVSNESELTSVGRSLTEEQRKMVEYVYGRELSDFEAGSEYVRMIVQESVLGTTTEMFRIQSLQQNVKNVVSKIIKYLKSILGNTPKSRIAAKVVKNLEDFIKDNRENAPKEATTKRRPAEKQKPKITWSLVPGTRVIRIMYSNRQFFIKEQNGAFYEVYQPSMGRWEPVQDGQIEAGFLGYNITQAKAALDKRAEDSGLEVGEKFESTEDGMLSESGPWADDESNELFNQLFGGRSAAQKALDIVNDESQDENVYDPLDDFSWSFSSDLMILQDYFLTALKRSEGDYEQNPFEYERATLLAARAEWDMRELISEVFAQHGYDTALNYFLFQVTNENIPIITRQLALRLLIERFEGIPDLANNLKTRIDKVFATNASMMLLSRKNFGTLEKGEPSVLPTGGSSRPTDKGLWGGDVSQADSDKITNSVKDGDKILADKKAIDDEMGTNFVSEEVYEQMSLMVDEAEQRYEETVQALKEVRSSLLDVKKSAEKIDKEFAAAKAAEAKSRITNRYSKENNPVKKLIEKINKIAEQC